MTFNYDYSRTMWMKMFMAKPDFPNNRSDVLINYEQALDIIRVMDNITQGITKIVYLVGWQGLGHDDCYPEMWKYNDALKRDCDKDGRESFAWLAAEAKKYHTIVSVHGNVSDEYGENESHEEIVKANAVVNDIHGEPAVIEIFNGRNAYKISYKQYYESGIFKKQWDRFMEAVPEVREAGTIHLDNFCVAESLNPRTDVEQQNEARAKMLDYIAECGIDVTSEYTYRELLWRAESPDHPIRKLFQKYIPDLPESTWKAGAMRTLGRIPATWWTSNVTAEECVATPPSLYSGHLTDKNLAAVYYGAMHGEDIWMNNGVDAAAWAPHFIREFCTYQLPYFYLNRHERLGIMKIASKDHEAAYVASFSDGVVSRGDDLSIAKNGIVIKRGNNVILPLTDDNRTFIAYSENGRQGEWNIPDAAFTRGDAYKITAQGNVFLQRVKAIDGKITLSVAPGQAIVIRG